ncbi:hypothetical protein FACS189429_2830 [Bacteroidia bacterium]|nr:hypothetical protein FACS189429_2830 [Bacteroidia bacterium]GHV43752.1 hypothetical protein FACS1894180_3780 [Bacteroidia bacterium]
MNCEIEMLLALLRAALWGQSPAEKLFAAADDALWGKTFAAAAAQGVRALAFDGVVTLPQALQPPRALRLAWAAQVDAAEKRFDFKRSVLSELNGIFQKNSIKMLNFKGFALAQYYPVPAHREFGDLDIYLFGKTDEGNDVLVANGASLNENDVDKHSTMRFKNILIENHHYFLNTADSRKLVPLNKKLIEIADSQQDNEMFPSAFFNALEHVCHSSVHHFARGGISLRFLSDWAVLLVKEQNNFDFEAFQNLLQSVDLLRVADALTALCVKYLGLQTDVKFAENTELENTIFDEITGKNPLRLADKNASVFKKIIFNLKHYRRQHKYFELMYPGEDFRRVISSIFYHIRHPETLAK